MRRLYVFSPIGFLIAACLLVMLRFSLTTPHDLDLLVWEETSIYLHAAEKSFAELFLMPDTNYINFLSKFAAFISLKFFKAFASFPLVNNFVTWFLAACFCLVFLSKRFEVLVPSVQVRLALCAYLYLLPVYDMSVSFNQSYYLFFTLLYYLLVLNGQERLRRNQALFIILTAPFSVFSKPVFFIFSFAYLFILGCTILPYRRNKESSGVRIGILVYLLALYAFQALFMSVHYANLARFARAVTVSEGIVPTFFLFCQKAVIFVGYGFICPFAHLVNRFGTDIPCYIAGIFVVGCFVTNIALCLKRGMISRIVVLGLLSGSFVLFFYGALTVDFLYDRFFLQNIYDAFWGHRMIFPVILFSLFNVIFCIQAIVPLHSKSIICFFLILSSVLSYSLPTWNSWNVGFKASFTWSQTSQLINERYPFIPHAYGLPAQGVLFYYTRGIGYLSDEMPFEIKGTNILSIQNPPRGKKILYILLQQVSGNTLSLGKNASISVDIEGVKYTGRLINPGLNSQYLFMFSSFIPSESLLRFTLSDDESEFQEKSFNGRIVGI